MEQIAKDAYLLDGFPKYVMNVYLLGDVLIDAGTRFDAKRILRQFQGRRVTAHALTHAHPDHQGASKVVCETLNIPFWCGTHDVAVAESGDTTAQFPPPRHWSVGLQQRMIAGAGHPVARALQEGDDVGGFTVVETPGHSPGHIAFWRESDRVLVLGDVLFNKHPVTGQVGLREPFAIWTPDPAQNRATARKLAALRPATVCFGHGPPLRDEERFQSFVAQLSAS
ncbi:MAG: MBL fold metallo-hydrolase [Chloroflexales bacterium]|nr:MBL fold metallo-hydrolase [Chloroflexales bacterium]